MAKPRYTDEHKFPPGGYVKSAATDVSKTFKRIRAQQAEQVKAEAEAMKKVRQIRKVAR